MAQQPGLARFSNREHQRSAVLPSRSKSIDRSAEIAVLSARNHRPLYGASSLRCVSLRFPIEQRGE
jgi:hypothetical protein